MDRFDESVKRSEDFRRAKECIEIRVAEKNVGDETNMDN